jgi:hypothetical protein
MVERGFSLSDFNMLTPGMIFDILITSSNENLKEEDKEDVVKKATQRDFDNF